MEKQVKSVELLEFLQPKHVTVERSESTESKDLTRQVKIIVVVLIVFVLFWVCLM